MGSSQYLVARQQWKGITMSKTIHLGDIGPDVATWQSIIGVTVDGRFGPKTVAATRAWQEAHNLKADGIVGPATWAAAGVVEQALPPLLKGVDLSAVQGVLDGALWERLAELGIRFAMMRAVVGNETWSDGAATENAKRAAANGIIVGAYVFPYPLPHLDPVQQAEHFVKRLEGMGPDLSDLPPAFDAEWPPREEYQKQPDGTKKLVSPWEKWKCSPPQLRDWIARCLARCEELTACTWTVYSYRYWLKCIEAEKLPELANRPLWLADYSFSGRWPTSAELGRLKPPAPWSKITIVQHDGNGGMKLPDGRDADFNCLLGGEDLLASLTRSRSEHEALGLVSDRTLGDYRRNRLESDVER
jgi:GH25 family lysozyme M1 (1,4-beta-N-acetylmuramidase)